MKGNHMPGLLVQKTATKVIKYINISRSAAFVCIVIKDYIKWEINSS